MSEINYSEKIEKIIHIIANSKTNKEKIDMILVESLLIMDELGEVKRTYTFEQIKDQVIFHTGIHFNQICSNSRKREIKEARQMCHYKARLFTKERLEDIGKFFGNRDHSTVLNSFKTIKALLDTDKNFKISHELFLNN